MALVQRFFLVGAADEVRPFLGMLSDDEEICSYAFRRQRIEHAVGHDRRRAIAERQDYFVVAQRQRSIVLRSAHLAECGRIDRDHAVGADRRGISRAFSVNYTRPWARPTKTAAALARN